MQYDGDELFPVLRVGRYWQGSDNVSVRCPLLNILCYKDYLLESSCASIEGFSYSYISVWCQTIMMGLQHPNKTSSELKASWSPVFQCLYQSRSRRKMLIILLAKWLLASHLLGIYPCSWIPVISSCAPRIRSSAPRFSVKGQDWVQPWSACLCSYIERFFKHVFIRFKLRKVVSWQLSGTVVIMTASKTQCLGLQTFFWVFFPKYSTVIVAAAFH